MGKSLKLYFQDIHYNRIKPNFFLKLGLSFASFFYSTIINIKNFLYNIGISKEYKCSAYVICVGNLTTGGVGKTPIVQKLANDLSKENNVAIISRGYGSKIKSKKPILIKDSYKTYFNDGSCCGDEIYQLAVNTPDNVTIIIGANRKASAQCAIVKHNCNIILMDDGFSNRKLYKDKTILLIDSKMRFGNGCLLPKGPLREPISQIKRADEIILVDKNDDEINSATDWVKQFKKPYKICKMRPSKIYNLETKALVSNYQTAIAFCAIGQPSQFYNFAKEFYELKACVSYPDHHIYTNEDIKNLIQIAKKYKTATLITTQKDEAKLKSLLNKSNIAQGYCFNVLELCATIE